VDEKEILVYLQEHVESLGDESRGFFQIKTNLRSISALRAELISLALLLQANPEAKATLVLIDPQISSQRLELEFEAIRRSLHPGIAERLDLAFFRDETWKGLPKPPSKALLKRVSGMQAIPRGHGLRLGRPDHIAEVTKLLILHRLRKPDNITRDGEGFVTRTELMRTIGCSYPTVAGALKRLGRSITQRSDRSVALNRFPEKTWAEIVLASERSRHTLRFADRSGQVRSPSSLLRRLNDLDTPPLGLAGTLGARHWYPDLDLHGDPRLDISMHCPGDHMDLNFVEKLDPALKREEDTTAPASLVIHAIRRKEPYFTQSDEGLSIADPVECMLDLHELRLEPQADSLYRFLERGKKDR
jgi:hypothetical protein